MHATIRWACLVAVALVLVGAVAPAFAQDDVAAKLTAAFDRIRPVTGLYGQESAANQVLQIATTLHTARPELVAALSEKNMVARWTAARALGIIGPEARGAVPALAAALPTSEWYTQVMIAWALARMGPVAEAAVPALSEALRTSRDVWVKREVAAALGAIGPGAAPALPLLATALQDTNAFVRVAAASALYLVGKDTRGLPLLIEALKDPLIVGTRVAADAVAELGEGARPAVPALVAALQDPAPCARVAAARALWLTEKSTQGVPALLAAQGDPQTEVRTRAAETLRLIGAATNQTFPAPAAPAGDQTGPRPLVFEVEDYTGPADAIVKNQWVKNKWRLSTDDARWTRSTVLASPSVMKDYATPEEGAPVLHTHVTGIPPGRYVVTVGHTRPLALSLDEGKSWRKFDAETRLGTFTIEAGSFDLWVDDRYAAVGSLGPSYYDTLTFAPATAPPGGPVRGWATERVRERLDRGLAAVRTGEGVSLSWRLLVDDPATVAFDVYRAEGAGPGRRLNATPIVRTTDFADRAAPQGTACRYWVTLAGAERDRVTSAPVAVAPDSPPYLPIKFQGNYRALGAGIGDLDGDGRMDYVIKQPETQIWGFLYTWYRSPDTYKLEAYNADGKLLWRQSMGWGIEMGIWFAPYVVYDFDGDGRAEVACKATDADPRDAEGMCNEGAEYVAILDGRTGALRCKAPWPNRDGFGTSAKAGDVAARNQIGVAYLDGKTPCVIVERGTYGLQKVIAYHLRGDQLECLWQWDNATTERTLWGQGAHTLHAADVDGDGRDEVILGSSVLDDNGAPLWTTGMGHPDVCYVGDFDPANPGLEVYYALETPQRINGVCLVDARSGKVLWGRQAATGHVGWGLASDIDPAHAGCEAWAQDEHPPATPAPVSARWLYSARGELIAEGTDIPKTTTVAYWDADVQRELVTGGQPRDYRGGVCPGTIQGSVLAVVDVIGDWREEIITCLPGELRVYTTAVPAEDRRPCLLQDPTYRLAVPGITSGYYSQPMLGYLPVSGQSSVLMSGPPNGLAPAGASDCTVLVVAAGREALTGVLQLSTGPAAVVTPTAIPVSVPAGGSVSLPFRVRLAARPSPLAGRVSVPVTAVLQPAAGEGIEARTSFPVLDKPLAGVPLTAAGDFVEQSGGEARARTDKPGSAGRALSHWNYKGHRITWQIQVPQAGRYHLVIRYGNCWGWIAERSLLVDGKALPGAETVPFPPVGTVLDEWATLPVRRRDGTPAVWELTAGLHRIVMENTNDCWLNLDQLAFVPAT